MVIINRVLGIAPLPEKYELVGKMLEKFILSWRQPFVQLFPLPCARQKEVGTSVLREKVAFGVERDAQICPVYFFFDKKILL